MHPDIDLATIQKKRFIAGARCPSCGLDDKIFTYETAPASTSTEPAVARWRACASCDFREALEELNQANSEELPTRVNQHRLGEQALAHETPVEKVRFFDGDN